LHELNDEINQFFLLHFLCKKEGEQKKDEKPSQTRPATKQSNKPVWKFVIKIEISYP
jgi:hypothetical protein